MNSPAMRNWFWLPLRILLITCSIEVSRQQQKGTSIPVGFPARIRQNCPTQEDINNGHINARRLIEISFTSMSPACGGDGWRRVVFLNMYDPNETCPSNWTLNTAPVRGCGRSSTRGPSCDSVVYPVRGQAYSSVCGRILAYHKGLALGFGAIWDNGQNTAEDAYVSGVSVTHGLPGARQHIWTFAGALTEQGDQFNGMFNCPCSNASTAWNYQLPLFLGNDYFCDTGNRGPAVNITAFYTNDPLWDGNGCGPISTCCEFNNPPWFHKNLATPTSDDLEIRMCYYEYNDVGSKFISLMEIYVQ